MALMTDKLRAIMAIDPDRAEIAFDGADYSWGQIAAAVRAIEAALGSMGLPQDARIGVMLRNRPGHVAAIIAVLSTDRCLVTLIPILPDERLFADVRFDYYIVKSGVHTIQIECFCYTSFAVRIAVFYFLYQFAR